MNQFLNRIKGNNVLALENSFIARKAGKSGSKRLSILNIKMLINLLILDNIPHNI